LQKTSSAKKFYPPLFFSLKPSFKKTEKINNKNKIKNANNKQN